MVLVEEGAEHSLESYAVFRQYLEMVEGKMEGFMASEGISPEAFQAKCAECVAEDGAMDTYVSALVSSWEYDR